MKLLTLTLAAAVAMAATGCETKQEKAARMDAKGLVRTPDGRWVPKGTRFFGSGHPWVMPDGGPAPIAFDPTVFNQAMAPRPSPAVIVAPSGPGITTAGQVGGTTMVSTIGGAPIYSPPIFPYSYGY
jgi:hypothetical protein